MRLSGLLHGLDEATIAAREDAIAAFADIGPYLDQPVRTYSSGMYVRLAFAVMAHVDADVLIVDEALAVGDIRFVQKCLAHLDRFRAAGGTLLFVSHDLPAVQRLCQRVIWLDRGRLRMDGPPRDVTEAYFDSMIGTLRRREAGVGTRESSSRRSGVGESGAAERCGGRFAGLRNRGVRADDGRRRSGALGVARIADVRLVDDAGAPVAVRARRRARHVACRSGRSHALASRSRSSAST